MATKITFRTSVSWKVLSSGSPCQSNGFWTLHHSQQDAVDFADGMATGRAYEITNEFMYDDDEIVGHVSEKWRLLK